MHPLALRWAALLAVATLAMPTAQAQQALVSVDVVVKQQFIQTSVILGRLVARQAGTVGSRIAGTVSEIMAQVGERVSAGQPIAIIDPEPLALQKQLAASQNREAVARVGTARAQLALATQNVKRFSALQSSAAISKATIDDAIQQQQIAFARVKEAEASLGSSAAAVAVADLNLRYANIEAPFDGTVIAKLTEVGSYLQPGQAVVQLISEQLLELEADIPANRLSGLSPGRAIAISLEHDNAQDNSNRYQATLRAIVPQEDPNTRTRRGRFNLDDKIRVDKLAAQQSVMLHIPSGRNREIISVHKDAIIRRGADSFVYVVEQDLAEMRKVQIGAASGNRLEVLDGLAIGDLAVIRGNERLQPQQKVAIAGES